MAEIYPWDGGRVIKLFRNDWPEAAQHELRIARMAYEQGAVTPQAFEIVRENGRPGIVYERVPGISLLRTLGRRPWLVFRLARQFAGLHHTVHRCRAPDLPPARPALAQAIQNRDELSAATKASLRKLLDTLPDGDALLHGDFHPDNVMVTPQKMLIVDWPNAAQGCPLADVARTTVIFRVGEPPAPPPHLRVLLRTFSGLFRSTYLRAYFAQSCYPFADLAPWEAVLAAHRLVDNIPGEAERLVRFIRARLSTIQ